MNSYVSISRRLAIASLWVIGVEDLLACLIVLTQQVAVFVVAVNCGGAADCLGDALAKAVVAVAGDDVGTLLHLHQTIAAAVCVGKCPVADDVAGVVVLRVSYVIVAKMQELNCLMVGNNSRLTTIAKTIHHDPFNCS